MSAQVKPSNKKCISEAVKVRLEWTQEKLIPLVALIRYTYWESIELNVERRADLQQLHKVLAAAVK